MPRFALLVLVFVACAPGGATMVVENRSSSPITDVVVSAREVQYKIAKLEPGELRAFSVRPRGESGVAVSYKVQGRAISVPAQGYFEGDPHYVVVVAVDGKGADIFTTIKTSEP